MLDPKSYEISSRYSLGDHCFFESSVQPFFWWAKPSNVALYAEIRKCSFFCPTCVCYTRGWLPGVCEPFLSFRFTATIRSRGPRGRAEQCIHGTISQILYLFRTSRLMKFPLLALYQIVFFETIKSHEISFPCSLQDLFLGGNHYQVLALYKIVFI